MKLVAIAVAVASLALVACGGGETSTSASSSSSSSSSGAGGGCPSDLPASCPANAPHYHDTIGPLIAAKCATCHRAGGQEPTKPLVTYADVDARKTTVLTQIYSCRMPLATAPQLTLAEREELLAWLVCGAKND